MIKTGFNAKRIDDEMFELLIDRTGCTYELSSYPTFLNEDRLEILLNNVTSPNRSNINLPTLLEKHETYELLANQFSDEFAESLCMYVDFDIDFELSVT